MATRIRPPILRSGKAWRSRTSIDLQNRERRSTPRYTVNSEVELELADNVGQIAHGTLVNISSKGVLIATSQSIPIGTATRVVAPWPAPIESAAVTLQILGETVRAENGLVAIRISHFVFRTQRAARVAAATTHFGG
jgi:hypothetical protein